MSAFTAERSYPKAGELSERADTLSSPEMSSFIKGGSVSSRGRTTRAQVYSSKEEAMYLRRNLSYITVQAAGGPLVKTDPKESWFLPNGKI